MNGLNARLISMVASASLLAYAIAMGKEVFAVSGAILFVLVQALQLLDIYDKSKKYRATGTWSDEISQKNELPDRIAYWIGGVIVIAGVVAFATEAYFVPGAIIWIGSIAIWVISGVIVAEVAGIPLRMGYAGWYVYRPRRRRKRSR